MGIEGGRCGVVHAHAGRHAHGSSGLLCPHRDAVYRRLQVGQHAQRAVFRFVRSGQCRAGRGRVGHAVGGRVGGDEGRVGELREAERCDADAAFECGQIGFGAVYLVGPHAVADEVEDILGPAFGHCPEGNDQQQEGGECLFQHFSFSFWFMILRCSGGVAHGCKRHLPHSLGFLRHSWSKATWSCLM